MARALRLLLKDRSLSTRELSERTTGTLSSPAWGAMAAAAAAAAVVVWLVEHMGVVDVVVRHGDLPWSWLAVVFHDDVFLC